MIETFVGLGLVMFTVAIVNNFRRFESKVKVKQYTYPESKKRSIVQRETEEVEAVVIVIKSTKQN